MFTYSFVFFTFIWLVTGEYQIQLTNDGPIIKGGIIHFKAEVLEDGRLTENSKFEYYWEDDAIPTNKKENTEGGSTDIWTVTYKADVYPAGKYIVQVTVKRCVMYIYCYPLGSARDYFTITDVLNGALHLEQQNQTKETNIVSNNGTVIHVIDIKKSDMDYIKNAPLIETFWFVDCVYYNTSSDFKFAFNYTKPDEDHIVEALVKVDFSPPPPPTTVAPTTTTAKPNVTTTPTTVKPTTTVPKHFNITTTTSKSVNSTSNINATTTAPMPVPIKLLETTAKKNVKRSVTYMNKNFDKNNKPSQIKVYVNGTLVPYNGSFPYACNNDRIIMDENKTFGFFRKKLTVKAPLSSINITGNTWLQPGDVLSLKVSCAGSGLIEYCILYEQGAYNVTGNETCFIYRPLDKCEFSITRYFLKPKNTIVIVLKNDVSHVVKSVFVNIYKVNRQTQLSVIVVPVAFSLVAVVLVIFGVAYYIQNRSRFIVEVADFNFRQQLSDIEYKTFTERLRDSIANAFTRAPSPSTSEVPVWPPGGQNKYGSMT